MTGYKMTITTFLPCEHELDAMSNAQAKLVKLRDYMAKDLGLDIEIKTRWVSKTKGEEKEAAGK